MTSAASTVQSIELTHLLTARLGRGESVDPSEYYFRIAPFLETASEKYAWLNSIVVVGTGNRLPAGPVYTLYEVR